MFDPERIEEEFIFSAFDARADLARDRAIEREKDIKAAD
jgi:hypothetical protein